MKASKYEFKKYPTYAVRNPRVTFKVESMSKYFGDDFKAAKDYCKEHKLSRVVRLRGKTIGETAWVNPDFCN